jgi:hypothetical protein
VVLVEAGLDWRDCLVHGEIRNSQIKSRTIIMKRIFWSSFVVIIFTITNLARAVDDTDAMQGKWLVKRTSEEGRHYTQTVELKKDKFIFEIKGQDDSFTFHAEGEVKFEKAGEFSAMHFLHIRTGQSAEDMHEVDDEHRVIYVIDGDTWTVAMNFAEPHRNEKPRLDVYQRVKAGSAKEAK